MSSPSAAAKRWLTAERLAVAGLLAFTLLVRSAVMWAMQHNLADDPDAYREIAENLLVHGVFGLGQESTPTPTAYRPPLYPIVLSNLPAADGVHVSLVKVAVVHVLLGILTVLLTYLTARQLCGAGFQPALLSALLVACDPLLLNQQTLVMTETLAAFLAILSLWCLTRFDTSRNWWNAGLAGGAIALAALCRPTFLPWLGLVGVGVVLMRPGKCGVRNAECGMQRQTNASLWPQLGWRFANGVALGVVVAAVMLPWAIRNQRVFGKPILTTTHGGYTLLLGNNVSFYEYLLTHRELPWKGWDYFVIHEIAREIRLEIGETSASVELSQDQDCYERAYDEITSAPRGFVTACLFRVSQLWSPLPNKLTADESTSRRLLRYATAAWFCGVYLLAAVGVWRLRWQLVQPPWVWGVLLCLTFTAVHTLYWCNLRMRAPLMPFVALVAAAGIGCGKRATAAESKHK